MIQLLAGRYKPLIAFVCMTIFYCDALFAEYVHMRLYAGEAISSSHNSYQDTDLNDLFFPFDKKNEDLNGPTPGDYFTSLQDTSKVIPLSVGLAPSDLTPGSFDRDSTENNARVDGGGPSQPEMGAFQSVNSNNMVDLYSGDFSYNIPLLDVGGYPVNLSYRSGISMDQEASWVGLGWNINPGAVTRNLRGIPDDFDGGTDTVRQTTHTNADVTVGASATAGFKLLGFPITDSVGLNATFGMSHNTRTGWGIEYGIGMDATLNAGKGSKGSFTSGLSITNSSQNGLTVSPTLSYGLKNHEDDDNITTSGNISTKLSYNSRAGLNALQLSAGIQQQSTDTKNLKNAKDNKDNEDSYHDRMDKVPISGSISFAFPSHMPSMQVPYTSSNFSFSGRLGSAATGTFPNLSITGYYSKTYIAPEDTSLTLPAYGYLHFQDGNSNQSALLDLNREKDIPYRADPPVPTIAIPSYTYDIFSITGEGTGGMFRAYRGDVGFVHDHYMRSKDQSFSGSISAGAPDISHLGFDISYTHAFTTTGAWTYANPLADTFAFRSSDTTYEAAYFRNPGEKSINSTAFYNGLGGNNVVAATLVQNGNNDPNITTTNTLNVYNNSLFTGTIPVTGITAAKQQRDKRTQSISYLTAQEASTVGVSKYIENYALNSFSLTRCGEAFPAPSGNGLYAQFYENTNLTGVPFDTGIISAEINFGSGYGNNYQLWPTFTSTSQPTNFSARFTGSILAPSTGTYQIIVQNDDGARLWINDSLVINDWNNHPAKTNSTSLNLVANQYYSIKLEYYNGPTKSLLALQWIPPGTSSTQGPIPTWDLFSPQSDTLQINPTVSIENRIDSFRRPNHISEIDVLNPDGRRYIYGIPVYNLQQKDVAFAIPADKGNLATGLAKYCPGRDNTTNNTNGIDGYFNNKQTSAYAHSFLLTQILSPDYVDLTGDGVTDDDLGDAIQFHYTKVAGIRNPFQWRTPYVSSPDSASFNIGQRTDNRTAKASYEYGTKEIWYLNSIESKNMVAIFTLANRQDLWQMDENGNMINSPVAKELTRIDLYTKADIIKYGLAGATAIKTVHFLYATPGSVQELCKGVNNQVNANTGKLTLIKIWFTYNGNHLTDTLNPYTFYYASNPSYDPTAYDRWSTYKPASQNPSSDGSILTNAEYPYSVQDSTTAAQNAAAWTLDSIVLPSGGKIKANYESDDYAYVQNLRAGQMFKLAGFGTSPTSTPSPNLYTASNPPNLLAPSSDNLYVFVHVPVAPQNNTDLFYKYLQGIDSIFFRLYVQMPTDQFGSGSEYVSCYASIDHSAGYGFSGQTIWFKVSGISLDGKSSGSYSPLAKAAIEYLRMYLPSKAYPNSDVPDVTPITVIKMLATLGGNILDEVEGFDGAARLQGWANTVDTNRTWVRLDNPTFKKYGGGLRVKSILIYDNWNAMTGQKESIYGQTYTYTTTQEINGVPTTISSGVASYEPMIGGEENPWHVPIQYIEQTAALAPASIGYTEEPLGESFFPSPSVGYSKVRVRSINTKNVISANGYEETSFYTGYDFPTITDRSIIDGNTKKMYKPALEDFLHIDAKNYLTVSQGFKVELNDMSGKMKSQATYPETDSVNAISFTGYYYKVDDPNIPSMHLSNTVSAINPSGCIDTTAVIGEDMELMTDMREQYSYTFSADITPNIDAFEVVVPLAIMDLFNFPQFEQNVYHSAAITKVINRYGILDSIVHIDKGSIVSTKNLLYDSETGDVLLTRTQNEFNDPIYNFTYPSHWAYDGMGEAYKNIDALFYNVTIKNGKITSGIQQGRDTAFFCGGDEILAGARQNTGPAVSCVDTSVATFPNYTKIWALDSSAISGGPKSIFFINADGTPFSGDSVYMKIVRSGRRNINSPVGSITMLQNPLVFTGTKDTLEFSTASKVLNASAIQYSQLWKVADERRPAVIPPSCPTGYNYSPLSGTCIKDTAVTITSSDTVCASLSNAYYTCCGSYIYSSFDLYNRFFTRTLIDSTNSDTLWRNAADTCISTPVNSWNQFSDSAVFFPGPDTVYTPPGLTIFNPVRTFTPSPPPLSGPLNRSGVWDCSSSLADGQWWGITVPITIPSTGLYYLGEGDDNFIRITIDGQLFYTDTVTNSYWDNFTAWHVFPVNFTQGYHTLKIQAKDSTDGVHLFSMGVEIYNNTLAELQQAQTLSDLNIIFSTANLVGQSLPSQYYCGSNYTLAGGSNDSFYCQASVPPLIQTRCISSITDTVVNPYLFGILGDYRASKSFVYYTDRAETDPTQPTNIRIAGTYANFAPYWSFAANRLIDSHDSTYWVWNSQSTMFNKKGFEIENTDPLGRYNSGLYGYNLTLPTAVIQNSRYREAAFEGFEDYSFSSLACDTACSVSSRTMDFSGYTLDSSVAHTGKYSLLVTNTAGVNYNVSPVRTEQQGLKFDTVLGCNLSVPALAGVLADSASLLPVFTPVAGDTLWCSAWVMENPASPCLCTTYTNDQIVVNFTTNGGGTSTITATPMGNIIDGWQKYEIIIPVPTNATSIGFSFQALHSIPVHYDDIRIHPYHSNMRSFVYDPVNLRLDAELDENNYATFYEYDNDGTLVRVKKETQQGIQTIKETRSALLKQ